MTSEQQHSPSPSDQAHGDLTPLEISIREALLSEAIAPPAGLEARVMRAVAPRASMPFNGRVMGAVAAGVLLLGVGLWSMGDSQESAPLAPPSAPSMDHTTIEPLPEVSETTDIVRSSSPTMDEALQNEQRSTSEAMPKGQAMPEESKVRLDAEALSPLVPSALESGGGDKTLSTPGSGVQTERRPANLEVKQ